MRGAERRSSFADMPNSPRIDRAEFLQGAAVLGLAAIGAKGLDPGIASAKRAAACGLTYRGVNYDTGTLQLGELSRLRWSRSLMRREIAAIGDELHCNAISITGSRLTRLRDTASAALDQGLHVMLQPRLYDHSRAEVLDHLARAAQAAERLRVAHPGRVTFIAGVEHTLFTPGFVPGETFLERIEFLTRRGRELDWVKLFEQLSAFLAEAVAVVREHFGGPVTYAAAAFEKIDWTPFDIVGLDYYEFHRRRAGHTRELEQYRRWDKPILICEFGCCTYKGAPQRGGSGYDIVDYSKPRPEIIGRPVRSEATQARYLSEMLEVFEAEDLLGAFIYTFIALEAPHSETPKYDLDIASFALVKVIREHETAADSRYTWKPKRAFHAVARHNRACITGPDRAAT